jgi:hypothetical protein
MPKIKISVRLKDNGVFIPLNEMTFKKFKVDELLKKRTISSYCSIIETLNTQLKETCLFKPKSGLFYWERFCEDKTIDQIIINLHKTYTIRSGSDLNMRIAPIITSLTSVPSLPAKYLAQWVSLKQQFTSVDYYQTACKRLGIIIPSEKEKDNSVIPDWEELLNKFNKLSKSCCDPRLQILSTIYKYGYVLRIASIYLTNFKNNNSNSNYLSLDDGNWIINHNKVRVQRFKIPSSMLEEIKDIISKHPDLFKNGWLLPKKNGVPYAKNSGIHQLTPWMSMKLPNCVQCRKSFETWHWYKSGCDLEKVEQMSTILDHTKTTAIIHYTPPYGAS